jgi:hypothetical protein
MRPPLGLEFEMTFAERIEGPLGPTTGSPARLCWQIAEATLAGPRITASLAMPGTDWIRVEASGIRRQERLLHDVVDVVGPRRQPRRAGPRRGQVPLDEQPERGGITGAGQPDQVAVADTHTG